jgi:hypothetical protein
MTIGMRDQRRGGRPFPGNVPKSSERGLKQWRNNL